MCGAGHYGYVSFVSLSLPVCSGVNANQNQLSFISPAASAVLHLEIAVL